MKGQGFWFVCGLVVCMGCFSEPLVALTDGDFHDEIMKVEKLLTGGYLRLGLFGACFIAGGVAIVKQNWMMLVAASTGALFIYLMKGWVTANFAAII
jgi:hypothetical protein